MCPHYNYTDDVVELFQLQVAKGKVPGVTMQVKFGEALVGQTEIDVWDGNAEYIWPTAAEIINIVSTSVADTLLGAGARQVKIFGLDANWNLQDEVVDLDGTTPVPTVNTYLRVYRMYVYAAGTSDGAVGTLSAVNAISANTLASITIGNNQTLMALYTVPETHVAVIMSWSASTDKGKELHVVARTRNNYNGGVWRIRKTTRVYQTAFDQEFNIPYVLGPRTDMRISAVSDTVNADCHAEWAFYLIEKTRFEPDYLIALLDS